MTRRIRHILAAAFIAILCVLAWVLVMRTITAANAFFSSALRDAGALETVVIGNTSYTVFNGEINAERMSPFRKFKILRIAYALTLARRSPIFGITGTDPAALKKSVDELEAAQAKLTGVQKNRRSAALIRSSLYPVRFLRSLAMLEHARQDFLREGTASAMHEYHARLRKTLRQYQSDLARFTRAFSEAVGEENVRFGNVGGSISTDTLRGALVRLGARSESSIDLYRSRMYCLRGHISSCSPDLDVTLPLADDAPKPEITSIPALVHEIRGLRAEMYGNSFEERGVIALRSSRCLSKEPGPYYFQLSTDKTQSLDAKFAGELFFIDTEKVDWPLMQSLKARFGIRYVILDPLVFYLCPDTAADRGRLYAIAAITSFAEKHPAIAPDAAARLLRTDYLAREEDAVGYMRAALAETGAALSASPETHRKLQELALMYMERGAQLDTLVREIARVTEIDIKHAAEGVAFDLSAHTRFLNQSAFISLFLAHDATRSEIELLRIDAPEHIPVRRYSDLKSTERARLLDDIRTFLTAENIIPADK